MWILHANATVMVVGEGSTDQAPHTYVLCTHCLSAARCRVAATVSWVSWVLLPPPPPPLLLLLLLLMMKMTIRYDTGRHTARVRRLATGSRMQGHKGPRRALERCVQSLEARLHTQQ